MTQMIAAIKLKGRLRNLLVDPKGGVGGRFSFCASLLGLIMTTCKYFCRSDHGDAPRDFRQRIDPVLCRLVTAQNVNQN